MRTFGRNLKIVAGAHVLAVAGILAVSWLQELFSRKPETVMPVEFVMTAPAAVVPPAVEPAPPTVEPPPPVVAPPVPPAPAPPRRKTIQVSRKRVTKRIGPPARPVPQASDLLRELMPSEPDARKVTKPRPTDPGFRLVRHALYAAWQQPAKDAVGDATVEAEIRIDRDGNVVRRRLKRPSGLTTLDTSVQEALDRVARIPGLTPSFASRHSTITITFRVE